MRLRIDIKLFKDGEMVYRQSFRKRTSAMASVQERLASEWDSGTCRVWYNQRRDFWNEFEFPTIESLKADLATDTEAELVRIFA